MNQVNPESPLLRLGGRRALVTGGSRGIGRAIVERIAAEGADVAFTYQRRREVAERVLAASATSGGRVEALHADLRRADAASQLYAEAERLLGPLDLLVSNAGIGLPGSLAEASEEDWETTMAVNARSTFVLMREAARRLRDGGRIVCVSTINTVKPAPGIAVYAASKGAVEQLAAVAARELGERGITVNSVSPGFTDTDLLRGVTPAAELPALAAASPLGRLGTPADVADAVAFLLSPEGGWLTGQNLRPSGGVA